MNKRFLFITANSNETEALLRDQDFFDFEVRRSSIASDNAFYNVGKFGAYDVVHFELVSQGSINPSAAILAISDAIKAWHPDAVILVGIAFGKDNEDMPEPRQHIGDVLISTMVADYLSGKIKDNKHEPDGLKPPSGPQLVSTFKHYCTSWEHVIKGRQAKVEMGLILSGDIVVDDEDFKKVLFSYHPRAIGGEMEGRGAYSACARESIEEWIIVKAICDWGMSKSKNKQENQIIAAESAVSLLKHIFSKPEAFDKLPVRQRPHNNTGNDTMKKQGVEGKYTFNIKNMRDINAN